MENKYRYLSKNVVLFTISNIGSKIITFLLVPLYTSYLSTQEYGVIDFVGTLVSITLPVFTCCLESAILRFSLDENNKKDEVISSAVPIWLRAVIFSLLFCLVIFLLDVFNEYENILGFYFIMFLCSGLKENLTSIYRGIDRVEVMVETSIISSVTVCLLNIIFLTIFHMGMSGYILALIVSSIICIIWGSYRVRIISYIKISKINKKLCREIQNYGGPMIFNQIGWWLNNSLDKYIVIYFLGMSQNGIYSIAYKIPTILSILSTIFSNAWSLSVIKEYDSNDAGEFATRMYKLYNALLVLCCSALLVVNVPIAKFLFANEFFAAWEISGILVVSVIFNGLSGFLGSFFAAAKDTKSYAISTITGGIINVIVSFCLVQIIGIKGVAIGTLISYVFIWVIRYRKCRKYITLKNPMLKEISMYVLLVLECMVGLKGFSVGIICVQLLIFVVLLLLNINEFKMLFLQLFGALTKNMRRKKNGKISD